MVDMSRLWLVCLPPNMCRVGESWCLRPLEAQETTQLIAKKVFQSVFREPGMALTVYSARFDTRQGFSILDDSISDAWSWL